ncbi:hypothetical protein GOEFS_086_00530 [Gordonia effusa NBRC 100432]|uniref:DUF1707 domain-containing protein n=2 Tax=Gordonia effusa TaxID=263908 RepID=H0R332_9ACTN|nr:hypothetical protein GOEFS_086_00530 [Gordonia effusa NBRC 100432]
MGSDPIRARDTDRVTTLAILDDALADGQLQMNTYIERVEAVKAAATLAELTHLTKDLQRREFGSDHGKRRPRTGPKRSTIVIGVLSLLVVIFASIAVRGLFEDRDTVTTVSMENRDPLVVGDMYTVDGINEVIAAIEKRFGTTVIEGMHLFKEKAVVYVKDKASPVGHTSYNYSLGGQFHSPSYYGGQAVGSSVGTTVDVKSSTSTSSSRPSPQHPSV